GRRVLEQASLVYHRPASRQPANGDQLRQNSLSSYPTSVMNRTVGRCLAKSLVVGMAYAAGSQAAAGQRSAPLRESITGYRLAHDDSIVRGLSNFLAIPNLASDGPNIRRNAEYLVRLLGGHGVQARLLESPSGAPPAVYGELVASSPAAKTVVFYAHYDGQ